MKSFIITILLIIPLLVMAQSDKNFPPKKNYKKATVTLTSFEKIECKNLIIYSDSLTFTETTTGLSRIVLMTEVGSIRVKEGNNALSMALYGAGIFAGAAISNFTYVPAILGFAGGGAVIGSLIGLTMPKTKLYRINY
jgi:hypothetical protein